MVEWHGRAVRVGGGTGGGGTGGGDTGGGYADFFPVANALRPGADLEPLLRANDPKHYRSSFRPMQHRQSCAACHQEQKAGNSCLQCHNYHHRP